MQCSIFYLFQECAEKIYHCIPDNGLHSPHLKNATDKKHYSKTWVYRSWLNQNSFSVPVIEQRSESYLGLYNALGVKYAVTDSLTADLQAANQLGIFSLDWEEEAVQSVTDYFGLYAGVTYTVFETEKIRASLRGGVAAKLSSFSYQDPTTKDIHKAGILDFGIPIGVKVEF